MTSKVFSGPEFQGEEELDFNDVGDWLVEGMGSEVAKTVLDEFDWDGSPVMGITLKTSPDNRKVVNSNIYLVGEFMKTPREIKANRIFPEAEKDLRISYRRLRSVQL